MADIPIDFDVIGSLARAILAQISPLTGTRATGLVSVNNPSADDVVVPQSAYLLPVVRTELSDDLVFKVDANPATVDTYGRGGDWVVPAFGSLEIAVKSNLGGARHNLPEATVMRWDPPRPGIDLEASVVADMTDGADGEFLQRASYYEQLEASALAKDMQAGRLSKLPAAMLVWLDSTPVEGRTAGTNQGSTRLADGMRMFRETFDLYVISTSFSGHHKRQATGLTLLQAVTRLLTDQQVNRDGEILTSMGSLEIISRNRYARDDKAYVYALRFRVSRLLARLEDRTFTPWLRTRLVELAPGREAPEPTDPMTRVDVVDPNPPGPPVP